MIITLTQQQKKISMKNISLMALKHKTIKEDFAAE
jgi:hypothetical protein